MKKSPLSLKLLTLLLCSFLAVSCSKDDEEAEPELENQLEYNSKRYDLTGAYTMDFGPDGFVSGSDTHYGQAFLLTDFSMTTGAGSVVMDMYLFSAGTSGFKTGTFEYADVNSSSAATQYANKNFFFESGLAVDVNGDKEIDEDTEVFMITAGTIKVSGTAPKYTIEADVNLDNSKDLKARYTGTFTVIPADDEDELAVGRRRASNTTPFRLKAPKSLSIN